MDAAAYWKRVTYLGAYSGAVTGRLEYERQQDEKKTGGPKGDRIEVEPTKAGIGNSALASVIEMD